MKTIAIIPARSGSKGLPDKNIRLLNGKPLMAYSIEAAIRSNICDRVHVSTDSMEYASIAAEYGADEPFLRDVDNSGDSSSTWNTVREVLRKYTERGEHFDICVLLQPTSPLRTAKNIKEAMSLYLEKNAKSLTSICEVDHPVQWCFTLNTSTCSMRNYAMSPFKNTRRQELEKYYRENGAIYIVGVSDIINQNFDFYTDECVGYIMKREKSVDIDTIQDFIVAETLIKETGGCR